jgi:FixJ family two-component response regulator
MASNEPVVYLVDDDESVRKSLNRLLHLIGFRVRAFASAEAFLAIQPESPACLVLDVQLPGMSGLELQGKLAASRIVIPIIFITGYEDEKVHSHVMARGAIAFLQKPFDKQLLLDAIRLALGTRTPDGETAT